MHVLFWIAVVSLLFAAVAMGAVAWRTARGTRERESARVELLRALALPGAAAVPASGPRVMEWTNEFGSEGLTDPVLHPGPAAAGGMFAGRTEPAVDGRRWVSLAAVGALMVIVVTLYAWFAGSAAAPGTTAPVPAAAAAAASTTPAADPLDVPIELTALRHQNTGTAAFEVSGSVRNPAGGRALPQLVVVVDLYDAGGRVLTSQIKPLERPALAAGQTSAFSVTFPRVTGPVSRYRVEFRAHGRDAIPHVDRRTADAGAKPSSF